MHTFWKHKEATDKQQSFNGNRSFKFFAIPTVKVTVLYRGPGGFRGFTGYLGLALVFVRGGAQWGGWVKFYFQEFSASVSGAFILAGGLGAGL